MLGVTLQNVGVDNSLMQGSRSSADDSEEVPNLQGKTYSAFKITQQEWLKLELIRDMLQEPANAQQTFSATWEPTVWHTIPVLEYLQETWESMAGTSKFDSLLHPSYVYFICLALDPNYKVAYARAK
ncbi:hypothetical protein DFH29DRAFT_1006219 [Suillus ampliporus]|nr:hypothetical protein DFH29DRAFT_1006219 [Suillus ampliporus]